MNDKNSKEDKKNLLQFTNKHRIIDYTKDEFLKEYDIEESFFRQHITQIMEYYKLDKNCLKLDNEETANYNIKYEIAPLLALQLKQKMTHGLNPIYDKRRNKSIFSVDALLEYNNSLIKNICCLPNYLKYYMQDHYVYKLNSEVSNYIPLLLKKLILAFDIMAHENYISNGDIIINLVKYLDTWIYSYLLTFLNNSNNREKIEHTESVLKEKFGQDHYLTTEKNYSLDYLISETFKKFLREDIDSLNPEIEIDFKKSILNTTKNISTEDIQSIRDDYKEQLNLSFYEYILNSTFSNHEDLIKSNIHEYSSRLDYLSDNKDSIIIIFRKYIKSLLEKNINIADVEKNIRSLLDIPWELQLVDLSKYINNSIDPNDVHIINNIALQIYEEALKIHTNFKKFQEKIHNLEILDSIQSALNNALGQILFSLFSLNN
ncbi:hypothetical protein [Clostridium sp.]|jgi:hypothetical protein|uniref:hypothetical protein n=1 Tax=Clostridium sp. TaxID=1506 RepID=UPI002FDE2A4D